VNAEPRIALPDPQTLAPKVAQLLSLASDADGTPLLTVAALAHHPPLLGPFLGWAGALALEGALAKREHELLALRIAHRCGSAFEWDEHCGYAAAAGLGTDEIERVKYGPDRPGWSSRDATLLRLADELHDSMHVSDATLAALAREYPPAALVEMLYVVGQYTMLSMVANALLGAGG
jgi:alkylhydroperoxidase family enzyme